MISSTDDVRIQNIRPLIPPAILMEELPLSAEDSRAVSAARTELGEVVTGKDGRLMVVVGPCSIHDTRAALEYAQQLAEAKLKYEDDLVVVMRTYFEKPRTTVGWKGLINDPNLDGSFAINQGLRVARSFLIDVLRLGLPTGTEFLDPISPQFVADCVCWGAIGARTTESQVHRELASGLSMPVGFKNGTGGSVAIAVDAIRSAVSPHRFLSVTKQGLAAIVETKGNPHTHVILRGGGGSTNFDEQHVTAAVSALTTAKSNAHLMVDCSHANSNKKPENQPAVATALAEQVAGGNRGIMGVMLESFLVAGRQNVVEGRPLTYGQSITDGCLAWPQTENVLEALARASRARRG